jgi:hypothetical protein
MVNLIDVPSQRTCIILVSLYVYVYSDYHLYLWDIALMICEIYFNILLIYEYLYIITTFYVDVWLM